MVYWCTIDNTKTNRHKIKTDNYGYVSVIDWNRYWKLFQLKYWILKIAVYGKHVCNFSVVHCIFLYIFANWYLKWMFIFWVSRKAVKMSNSAFKLYFGFQHNYQKIGFWKEKWLVSWFAAKSGCLLKSGNLKLVF